MDPSKTSGENLMSQPPPSDRSNECESNSKDTENAVVGPSSERNSDDPHQPKMGRRRSVSVATSVPDVETVVVKAKRAARTLWILLHAQNCVFGNKCPNSGCHEAKLLLLHVKTCSVENDVAAPCPTQHKGCEQARKLMAHYRRCRSIRTKQADPTRKDTARQHVCLVCSMMARQARNSLEKSTSSASKTFSAKKPTARGKAISSIVLSNASEAIALSDPIMGPPPPRKVSACEPCRSAARFSPPKSQTASVTISEDLLDIPMYEYRTGPDTIGRARSSSTAESSQDSSIIQCRARSASLGSSHSVLPGNACETIQEETNPIEETKDAIELHLKDPFL